MEDKKYPRLLKRRRKYRYPSAPNVENQYLNVDARTMNLKNSNERIYVAVDVSSLWFACKNLFGEEYRISYPSLKKLVANSHTMASHIQYTAYVVSAPHTKFDTVTQQRVTIPPKNRRFIEYLENLGFKVKNKRLDYEHFDNSILGADWSIGITIDALDYLDTYDTFTLLSGVGDYSSLLQALKERRKCVEVITFRDYYSRKIHSIADSIIYLSDHELFRENTIRRIDRGPEAYRNQENAP